MTNSLAVVYPNPCYNEVRYRGTALYFDLIFSGK